MYTYLFTFFKIQFCSVKQNLGLKILRLKSIKHIWLSKILADKLREKIYMTY